MKRSGKASGPRGVIRRSQAITTFGVGALVDLPNRSAIVGDLDGWKPKEPIREPRLAAKLAPLFQGSKPRFMAPPAAPDFPGASGEEVPAYLFPRWFVERQARLPSGAQLGRERRSRRLVHRNDLDARLRLEKKPVVATRFVRGCGKGHVDDLPWHDFVHQSETGCIGRLRLSEIGDTGDLAELLLRCSCGKSRLLAQARPEGALGTCTGARPWLGPDAREDCEEKARLLIRTATNAWFPQLMSALSLPDQGSEVERIVVELWDFLDVVEDHGDLGIMKRKPRVAEALEGLDDGEVLEAIEARRRGTGVSSDRPLKQVELDALLDVPEGYGDDIPMDPNFHARRLPSHVWDPSGRAAGLGLASVIQAHRLREVVALFGFTRFDAVTRDVDGEYDSKVKTAALSLGADWLPAIENRGEGVFLEMAAGAVQEWAGQPTVQKRVERLAAGQKRWNEQGRKRKRAFPGGPYVMLHTLAHLLIESVALRCGYPAASIRERIYVDEVRKRFGVLLYTAGADAEGTLGGLVEQARGILDHLDAALETARLCSNDPVCAQHEPGDSREERWLHGAACHGCTLVAETSCEMANDYLDRALVAPVIGRPDAAFFSLS